MERRIGNEGYVSMTSTERKARGEVTNGLLEFSAGAVGENSPKVGQSCLVPNTELQTVPEGLKMRFMSATRREEGCTYSLAKVLILS